MSNRFPRSVINLDIALRNLHSFTQIVFCVLLT